MSTNYIVSAQKPTVIAHAVVGNLTGPGDLNLALSKINRVELYLITPDGLKLLREIPIYGRIAVIKLFRAKDEIVDSLLILTVKYHLSIISFTSDGDVITRATGYIVDRIGRPSETGIIACVHPSGLMAFRLYDGVLKIVEWSEGKDLRGFNVRCDELSIYDLTFLFDSANQENTQRADRPVLAYIYQDYNGRHLKAAELNLEDKEIGPVLWSHDSIEAEASIVIPVPQPCGGCLVIGRETISYYKGTPPFDFCAFAHPLMHEAQINCYAEIDRNGQRFLLGDLHGRLFILLLKMDKDESGKQIVKELKLELVGETSIPECLVYVDNGVVFVGSRFGDSQLIRLCSEPRPDGSFVTLLDTYTNLAPIRDMVVVNADGQQHVVTCSGAFKDGSLRIIRNGIGIEELASVELTEIKALFSLKVDSKKVDNYVVISFYHKTHIFAVIGEDLSDTQLEGFTLSEQTHYMGSTDQGSIVQITPFRIISRIDGKMREWKPSAEITITAVNDITGQIVLACTQQLFYIVLAEDIRIVNEAMSEFEIACLDISPIGGSLS